MSARKGFDYVVETETLRRYGRLTTAQKLAWLEEANHFIQRAAPPRVKRLHRLFRDAKI